MFDFTMQEIIDHKILTCRRTINCQCIICIGYCNSIIIAVAVLNTVDYIDPTGRCVFRTSAVEKDKVVFQMVYLLTAKGGMCVIHVWVCIGIM